MTNKQDSIGIDGTKRKFQHPVLQCWGLSLGEATCILLLLAYNTLKKRPDLQEKAESEEKRSYNPVLFIPPAILHLTCRVLPFLGLLLTSASLFQMLSISKLIFTCVLSKIFLHKSLPWYKWFGIFIITIGVVILGLGDMLLESEGGSPSESNPVLGDIFIVVSMMFYACQMTYEEKIVKKYKIKPMKAVGLEGSISLLILTILLIIFYFVPPYFNILHGERMEDALDGFVQLGNNLSLLASFVGTCLAFCCTLIAGITITSKLSAIHRIVMDTGRSVFVWAISLALGWQSFMWLQILGFLVMTAGVFIFNDILIGKKNQNHPTQALNILLQAPDWSLY